MHSNMNAHDELLLRCALLGSVLCCILPPEPLSPCASAGGCYHWAQGAGGPGCPISALLLPLESVRHTPRNAQQLAPHAVRIRFAHVDVKCCDIRSIRATHDTMTRQNACRNYPTVGTCPASALVSASCYSACTSQVPTLLAAGWHCASWKCRSHGSSALCHWKIHRGQRWCRRLSAARCSSPGALMAAPSCM